jgi:hypothetical protein
VGCELMRLPAGRAYYENRAREDKPITVRLNGRLGFVTRVTPPGNHIPTNVHVVFRNESNTVVDERWCALSELSKT